MTLYTQQTFYEVPQMDYWIESIMPQGQLCTVWGDGDAGKSCLAPDWMGAILTARPWQGREVRQGKVLYIPTENPFDFQRRFKGWEQEYGSWDGLDWAIETDGVQLLQKSSVDACVNTIEALGWRPDVIFIDTLGKAMVEGAGADPDKSRHDWNRALLSAERLRKACGPTATVVLISHSTKSGVMAGSAALLQGCFMVAELRGRAGDGATSLLHCTRLKTGTFPDVPLRFREVAPEGFPHTLVIDRSESAAHAAPTREGAPKRAARACRTDATRRKRQILDMYHNKNIKQAEIARRLGIPRTTVASTINRARTSQRATAVA